MVGNEAAATGVGLSRAHLAGMPPGAAHRGTAQRLGADDATQLALAHLIGDGGETRPGSVISFTLGSRETVGANTAVWSHTSATI